MTEFIDSLYKKNFGKKLFMFVMGMLISALAFNLFFDAYDIVPSGSSGLALIIANFIPVDTSIVIFAICLFCMILGLVFYGWEYASKMLAVTFLYPFFVKSTTLITRCIDLEDTSLFLIMVFGGGMLGFSSGLVRKSEFSPGGFCVIFDLLNKYFHISIGKATLVVNLLIIMGSSFTYGFESALYALIALMVSSYVVDRVIIGISDNKVFYIFTDKPLEVRDYVMDKLNYKITFVKVRGGKSSTKRKMLMSVIPTIEYIKLKEVIKEIDPDAFFLIVDAYESSIKKNCKEI